MRRFPFWTSTSKRPHELPARDNPSAQQRDTQEQHMSEAHLHYGWGPRSMFRRLAPTQIQAAVKPSLNTLFIMFTIFNSDLIINNFVKKIFVLKLTRFVFLMQQFTIIKSRFSLFDFLHP